MTDTDLITAGEAARLLGVKVKTFQWWVTHGRIQPALRPTANLWLYRREEVAALTPPPRGRPVGRKDSGPRRKRPE